jgi:predicted nucleic acid-binding protein
MNMVDSSGWLEYFADGPNAQFFSIPLQDTENLIVSTINIYEVFKVVLRERNEDAGLQAIALMSQGVVVDFDSELAIQAAKISITCKIPMADSIIFATTQKYSAVLYTQDEDFKGMPGVKYVVKK